MPNHVTNHLQIEGEEKKVKFVFDVIQGNQERQFIDFNKIIPAPAFCFNKSAGSPAEKLANELEVPIWTSFNRSNWGTKWNAYSQEKVSPTFIKYETAWSSSRKVIQAIADKFPMLKITLKYADEDSGSNVGVIIWHNGDLSENLPKSQSKDAYDIYFELHPDDKENYQFVDGEYQYIEEDC